MTETNSVLRMARRAWAQFGAPYGGSAEEGALRTLQREREFDAALAAHVAQVRAEAWDEGYGQGGYDERNNQRKEGDNPYRKTEQNSG